MLISHVLAEKGKKVATAQATDTVEAVVQKLSELRIGAVVVEDEWQKPIGIFSERDLVNRLARDGHGVLDRAVQEVMTTPVITCRSSDRIEAVLGVMTARRVRHLPVVDDGALVGIVSIGDLVKQRLDEKELEAGVLLEISRMRT